MSPFEPCHHSPKHYNNRHTHPHPATPPPTSTHTHIHTQNTHIPLLFFSTQWQEVLPISAVLLKKDLERKLWQIFAKVGGCSTDCSHGPIFNTIRNIARPQLNRKRPRVIPPKSSHAGEPKNCCGTKLLD